MTAFHPRRSVLYMPGSNARALEKAKTLAADSLILDLEDAVAPDAKAEARDRVCETVRQGGYGDRELVIRVNGLDGQWGPDDLAAATQTPVDEVLLPKVESATQVARAEAMLNAQAGNADIAIWCMLETPLGILHAESIAASRRVACLVMGTSDLVKDLRARHTTTRLPVLTSLSFCLLAARAYDCAILDGVHLDLADEDGFAAACRQGRDLGFDGKTLIHPKQIAATNAIFAPDDDEVEQAHAIIAVFEAAEREGKGVALLDGRLVENLHVENARRTLALAGAIAARRQN